MALRSLKISCSVVLLTLAFCAATRAQVQAKTGDPSHQISSQTPDTIPAQRPAPVAPTPAEMRAMSAQELDAAGDRMRESKDYLAAVDCYREAIRKHADAQYYNKIAISQLLLRHPTEAEKAAKKAVRKNKHLAEAWNNLAVSYYMRHKLDDAIRTYERAISQRPDNASFHNNVAAALMDNKQFERGMAEYRKAFELDPSFFEHTSRNGIRAHMSSPQDRAQFSFVMARLFASSGDLDRALHFLRSAIEDGYPRIDDVYREKEFAHVVQDERFLALMKDRPVAIR